MRMRDVKCVRAVLASIPAFTEHSLLFLLFFLLFSHFFFFFLATSFTANSAVLRDAKSGFAFPRSNDHAAVQEEYSSWRATALCTPLYQHLVLH